MAPKPEKESRPHRRIHLLAEKVDREALQRDANLTLEQFKEKTDELKAKLILERREFKKDEANKEVVEDQRKKLEGLTQDLLVVEANHQKLKEKEQIPKADDDASVKIIGDSKDLLEGLLEDLEANELLVDNGGRRSEETSSSTGRTVEIVLRPPGARAEGGRARTAETEEPPKEECEKDERNRILTRQVEELTRQQTQVMQQMMNMQQMMMMQQQQSQMAQLQQFMFNGPGFNSSPYQYHQPTAAGNWVYYPSGFQPQQPNIFAQPQIGPQQQQGVFPDQMHQQMQGQGQQWGIRPTQPFADQRYQAMPIQAGSFGEDALSYNMGVPPQRPASFTLPPQMYPQS